MLTTRVAIATEIAPRLMASDAALWGDWMQAVRSLPDDPYGVLIHVDDRLALLHVHAVPIPYYNRVLPATADDPGCLEEAAAFFRARHTPCRLDLSPFRVTDRLISYLAGSTFRPVEFQTNLFAALPLRPQPQVPGVSVREVGAKEFPFFARLYERAYHGARAPKRLASFRIDSLHARFERPGWRFYMALIDGIPAGGAALFTRDGVATLAGGATMPKFRGRGCQSALLGRRIKEATRAGCELVVSRCAVGSRSQRNMERAGLVTAYTKTIWEAVPP